MSVSHVWPRQPANPPEQVQCIICDVIADRVERPGWSGKYIPDGWGGVTGLPGLRCPECMAKHNAKPLQS